MVNIADDPNKEMIVRYSKFAVQSKLGVDNTPEKDKAVAEKDKKVGINDNCLKVSSTI